mgnify:FL=1
MINLKVKSYLEFIFVLSIISLISAFFIEYALGHKPCNLCLLERIPYGLAIILIILNYISKISGKLIILLLILTFIFSLIISTYHFGIEQGFFDESAICGLKDSPELITKEDILNQLAEKKVSCKDVTFRIFGLSLTGINIILSLIITIILLITFIRYEKIK